jgi:hypothetical protein
VPLGKPRWLPKVSAVNVQGLASFDPHKLARRLSTLSDAQFVVFKDALRELLQL